MSVKQISVFLENKAGEIAKVSAVMAKKGVNIRALSIADTPDFGILRIITEYTDDTVSILKEAGYACLITRVIAVKIDDEPGSLAKVMAHVSEAGINIEYAYAFIGKNNGAYMVIRVKDNEEAKKVLAENGIEVARACEMF